MATDELDVDYEGDGPGVLRRILTYPQGAPNKPTIFALHPSGVNVLTFANLIGVAKLTALGFNVVFPQALVAAAGPYKGLLRWDDTPHDDDVRVIDDTGFLEFAIDRQLTALTGSDKVFLLGYSNGAGMLNMYLHKNGGADIAAAAQVCGFTLGVFTRDTGYGLDKAIPMMMFQGTDDRLVPYETSYVTIAGVRYATSLGAQDMAKYYAEAFDFGIRDKARPVKVPNNELLDATRTTNEVWGGQAIQLHTIQKGGHTWPGGTGNKVSLGKTSSVDATTKIGQFFQNYD